MRDQTLFCAVGGGVVYKQCLSSSYSIYPLNELQTRDYLTLNNFELSEVLIALLKEHLHTLLTIDDDEMKRSIPSLTKQLLPEFAIYTDCIEVDSSKHVMTLPTMYVYKMKMKRSTGIKTKNFKVKSKHLKLISRKNRNTYRLDHRCIFRHAS